jgi:hypothetical protein
MTLKACFNVDSVNGNGPHLNRMDALHGESEYALSSVRFAKLEKSMLPSRLK